MRSNVVALPILCAMLAAPVRGEVIESTAVGFSVRNTAAINAPPAEVYAALTDKVGGWWDPAHTFSHDARNLFLDAKPGGCFCERLPDGGGVQHMSVVYASPGKLLRLTGAIGPLQEAALAGTMTWNLRQADVGTMVEVIYTVGGFRAGGFRDMPTVVDGVLRGQLARLKVFVETGRPDGGSVKRSSCLGHYGSTRIRTFEQAGGHGDRRSFARALPNGDGPVNRPRRHAIRRSLSILISDLTLFRCEHGDAFHSTGWWPSARLAARGESRPGSHALRIAPRKR